MNPKKTHALGRNEPCHCGSGRKYKKCCQYNDTEKRSSAESQIDSKKIIGKTSTGELFMPIRLCYVLYDKTALQKLFKKLMCMQYDTDKDRWTWNYDNEAKNIKLPMPWNKTKKLGGSIVLGSFYHKNENMVVLDLHSFERATQAILFFEKNIPRQNVAKLTSLILLNEVSSMNEAMCHISEGYDALLTEEAATTNNGKQLFDALKDLGNVENLGERRYRVAESLIDLASTAMPRVEKIVLDGEMKNDAALAGQLMSRQRIALEHWKGNKSFTAFDLIQEIMTTTISPSTEEV